MKLYHVTTRGMKNSLIGIAHGKAYVLADNAEEAYRKLRAHLDEKDYGADDERELEKVELLAEDDDLAGTAVRLFL